LSRRFGKTPSDSAVSFPEDEASIRGNLDPEQLVRLQINRCNIAYSAGDEAGFGYSVLSLLSMLPTQKRMEIEDMKDDYEEASEEFVFDKVGGWRAGTVEHPVKINGKLSPRVEKVTQTSYYKLFTLIQTKLEESNLSWRMDQVNEELGRVRKPDPKPTPTDINGNPLKVNVEENEEDDDDPDDDA